MPFAEDIFYRRVAFWCENDILELLKIVEDGLQRVIYVLFLQCFDQRLSVWKPQTLGKVKLLYDILWVQFIFFVQELVEPDRKVGTSLLLFGDPFQFSRFPA